jgi:ADP-ribosyl-[dinitrogen reductase] hydrolase
MTELPRLLPGVIALAEQAGRILAAEFTRPQSARGQGGRAPVDDEIEALLRPALLNILPAQWRGEESGHSPGPGNDLCWLVDPHDGTSAFLAGERGTAVSIALLRGGIPVLSVVHAPLPPDRGPDSIAWAEGMEHILRNGTPVTPNLEPAKLNKGEVVFVSHAAAEWPLGNGRAVQPARFVAMPSIAYRLARVAAGDSVAAVSLNAPCGWDYAAGHALLLGAGGGLLDEAGRPVTYTTSGISKVRRCFGGAPAAAAELAQRDWTRLREGQHLPRPRHPRRAPPPA